MRAADLVVRAAKKADSKREHFSISLVGSPAHQRVTQAVGTLLAN